MPHKDIHTGGLIHNYFDNKELDELYLSTAIRHFAGSFVTIFVPVYLLVLGFAIKDIAIYFLILLTSVLLFFPFGLKLNSIIGIKKTISLGIFISIIYYLLLNYLSSGNITYHFVALICGISAGIYWAGFHVEFSKFLDKGKGGQQNSLLSISSKMAGALGPIVGALLITKFSFNVVFLLSALFLFISMIPLFFTKDQKTNYNFSFKEIFKADTKRKAVVYWANAIVSDSLGIFWPIFIYISLKDVMSLGWIISITALIEIFFLFYIGKMSDKNKKKVMKIGVFSHAFSWLTRIFFISPLGILLNNMYSSFSKVMIDLPLGKIVYERSKKSKKSSNYFLFREFHLWVGRVIVLSLVIITNEIFWVFILSFFMTFVHLIVLKERSKK